MREFGALVRKHRQRLGMSQETLAERAEMHRTYITSVELGGRNLSLESICKLARALNVSLSALFAQVEAGPGSGAPASRRAHSVVDILLVEDDPRDVELTLAAFIEAGLTNRIHVVRDGAAALDYVFSHGQCAKVWLEAPMPVVLLDLALPKVHGLEVLRRIKADPHTRRIHVIVLTGSREDAHVREALRLGAAAYIVKPVDFRNFSAITPQLDCSWMLLGRSAQERPGCE